MHKCKTCDCTFDEAEDAAGCCDPVLDGAEISACGSCGWVQRDEPKPRPKNLRNFWIETNCDGVAPKAFGPKSADGGFSLIVKQRNGDEVGEALVLTGAVGDDGELILYVEAGKDSSGEGEEVQIFRLVSKREGAPGFQLIENKAD